MKYRLFMSALRRIDNDNWIEYGRHFVGFVSEDVVCRAMDHCILASNENIAINVSVYSENNDKPAGLGFESLPNYALSKHNIPYIELSDFSLKSICDSLSLCEGWKTESIKTRMTESIFRKFLERYEFIPNIICSLDNFLWATDEPTMKIIENVCLHPASNRISDISQPIKPENA